MLSITLLALALSSPGALAEDTDKSDVPEDGFNMGALPALNFNTDEGFGYGLIGTGYWYRDGLKPYKYALTLRYFRTTKNIRAHLARIDALDVGGLPLRITATAGYFSTLAANFCGYVGDGHCGADATQVSERAADALALQGTAREDFIRRYYLMRYTEPYIDIQTRTRIKDLPHKIEIMGGYRGSYYLPGTPDEQLPWPGSLYDDAYFPEGEEGFTSILQTGVVFDNRDHEPAPTQGYWSEISVRGAGPFTGSSWTFGGVNLTHRQYVTVVPKRVVWASRYVADTTFGDLPTQELARFGGLVGFGGIGGQYGGRGMRSWRLLGGTKALTQQELRYTFAYLTPGKQAVDLGIVGFGDVGWAARDLSDLSVSEAGQGVGTGLRVTWNHNFIVRADFGFSPLEDWGQRLYLNLDHIF